MQEDTEEATQSPVPGTSLPVPKLQKGNAKEGRILQVGHPSSQSPNWAAEDYSTDADLSGSASEYEEDPPPPEDPPLREHVNPPLRGHVNNKFSSSRSQSTIQGSTRALMLLDGGGGGGGGGGIRWLPPRL